MNETVDTGTTRSPKYVTFLVLLMSLISLLDNTLSLIDTRVTTYMEDDFGFVRNSGELQFWISIYGVLAFLVFVISWLNDAIGRKKGLIILVLVLGVPSILLPFVTPDGPAGLHPSMLFYGIITLGTIANSWEIPITEEAPTKKRGLYGALAFMVGMIPVYALTASKIADALGSWKYVYAVLGGILMIPCLIMLFFMKETDRWLKNKETLKHHPMDIIKSFKKLNKKDVKYIGIMTFVYLLWGIGFKYGSLATLGFFTTSYGMTEASYNTWLTVAGICLVLGALLSSVIMHKISRKSALIVGCIGSIASFLLLGVAKHPIFMVTLYFSMPIVLSRSTSRRCSRPACGRLAMGRR
jgi:MFS family permease